MLFSCLTNFTNNNVTKFLRFLEKSFLKESITFIYYAQNILFIHGLQLDLRSAFFTGMVPWNNWKRSAENLEAISSPLVRHRILAQDLGLSFNLKWAIFSSVMVLYEKLINGLGGKDDKGVQKIH